MICETDKAWMAGFTDGEGWIGIAQKCYAPGASIGNTSYESLMVFKSYYGGNVLPVKSIKITKSKKAAYYWHCPAGSLLQFLLDIHNYLVIKRQQCEVVLHLLMGRICHKPLHEEDIEFRRKMYLEARELNVGGKGRSQ